MNRIAQFLLENGCPYHEEGGLETYVLDLEQSLRFVDLAEEELVSIIGGDVYCKCKSGFSIGEYFYLAWSCDSNKEAERGTRGYFEYSLELARNNIQRIKEASQRQKANLYIGFVYEHNLPQS